MKWYSYMTKQERRNFQKVIAVCVVGAILILPLKSSWICSYIRM